MDACQLRLEDQNVRRYVSLGFLTLVTGSKFYCGPPFCGAVLFPPETLAELQAGHEHLPAGFDDYFTRHEVRSVSTGVLVSFSDSVCATWYFLWVGTQREVRYC